MRLWIHNHRTGIFGEFPISFGDDHMHNLKPHCGMIVIHLPLAHFCFDLPPQSHSETDYDSNEHMPPELVCETVATLMGRMASAIPELASIGYVGAGSSSNGVY